MFYQLPPAGNRVHLSGTGRNEFDNERLFVPYIPVFYHSGTAALAAAIGVAVKRKAVASPEVILPAYGCPDIVSAVVFSGAQPVLVDLEHDRPWMDLKRLSASISSNTVAIVAVDLFGIPERIQRLRNIASDADLLLIEDSAQAFPGQSSELFWGGDLVILSFGRGKPVTLLGGGAVLFREHSLGRLLPRADDQQAAHGWYFRLQALVYNLMSSPYLYWIPRGMPFLHLGETRYQPLTTIAAMDGSRSRLLQVNIHKYQEDNNIAQVAMAALLKGLCETVNGLIDLPAVCGVQSQQRLLRYPILVEREWRDDLFRRLHHAGLGPSLMYPTCLPGIPGVEGLLEDPGNYPVAEAFARRILTLPIHDRVRSGDICKMGDIFHAAFSQGKAQ